MKRFLITDKQKATKRIRLFLSILMCVGTILVIIQRFQKVERKTGLKIDFRGDSLSANVFLQKESFGLTNLFELYEQKKLLESIQQKDSLTQNDIKTLVEIDRKLNQLIDEKN